MEKLIKKISVVLLTLFFVFEYLPVNKISAGTSIEVEDQPKRDNDYTFVVSSQQNLKYEWYFNDGNGYVATNNKTNKLGDNITKGTYYCKASTLNDEESVSSNEVKVLKISYLPNGGKENGFVVYVPESKVFSLPSESFTKDNYIQTGWRLEQDQDDFVLDFNYKLITQKDMIFKAEYDLDLVQPSRDNGFKVILPGEIKNSDINASYQWVCYGDFDYNLLTKTSYDPYVARMIDLSGCSEGTSENSLKAGEYSETEYRVSIEVNDNILIPANATLSFDCSTSELYTFDINTFESVKIPSVYDETNQVYNYALSQMSEGSDRGFLIFSDSDFTILNIVFNDIYLIVDGEESNSPQDLIPGKYACAVTYDYPTTYHSDNRKTTLTNVVELEEVTMDNYEFEKGNSKEDCVITIGEGTSLNVNTVAKIEIDNTTYQQEDFEECSIFKLENGCIKLILKKDYLNSLSIGNHTVKVYLEGDPIAIESDGTEITSYDPTKTLELTIKVDEVTSSGSSSYKVVNTSVR